MNNIDQKPSSANLRNHAKKLWSLPVLRYIVIGGVSYVVELATILTLIYVFSLSTVVTISISFYLGLLVSFFLQKFLAFNDYRHDVKAMSRQTLAYLTLVVINYIATVFIVFFLSGIPVIVSRTVALLITTTWNYLIYRNIVFK